MTGSPQQPVCSPLSRTLGESALGSAASALAWVAVEQNGPWGRNAATESHLDADLGRTLDALASAAGARLALVRSPGRHSDQDGSGTGAHRVWLACSNPSDPWLLRGHTDDLEVLRQLDVAALVVGDAAAVRASVPHINWVEDGVPLLLVCTNGRRDLCCAVLGRPVALEAAARRPGQVWETSHTGGHRYSPTAVLLPSGQTLARLDPDLAVLALDGAADGRLPASLHGLVHDRGLSSWDAPVRAAVSAVRACCGEPAYAALSGTAQAIASEQWTAEVRHRDGRIWTVAVTREVLGPDRPESCLKPAVPQLSWSAHIA